MKLGALVLVMVLFLSPLAMAGDLGSADSNFLFSKDQATATTISNEEMQSTQGQLGIGLGLLLSPAVGQADNSIFNNCINLLTGCSIVIVGD